VNSGSATEWWRPQPAADSISHRRSAASGAHSSAPFWALMGFTFVMLIAPQTFFPVLQPLRLALLMAVIAAATYLWDCVMHRRALSISSREIWLAVALGAWALLTIPFSYSPAGSLSLFLDLYAKSLMVFWLLTNVVSSVKRLSRVFWALSLIAIPLALSAVYNFSTGVFLDQSAVKRIVGYESATTGNPNDLALMLNLILPLTVVLLLIHRKPLQRFLLLACICLSAVAIVLTFSRGGFVTLATLLVLYLIKFRRRPERRWTWRLAAILILCIPLAGPGYLSRLATITNVEADVTGSAQERWSDMAAAFTFTLRHPILGSGMGENQQALREERGAEAYHVHNVYLEYGVELGALGLILFLMLLVGCIQSVRRVQRRSQGAPEPPRIFYLAEGIEVSLIAFAVAAFFHPIAYAVYFYYIAGLAAAARAISQTESA
jgi:probable O-glycosylation ligase (exosortase A-associated)